MSGPLAYHVVVLALEASAGWTPMARFAESILRACQGHLAYQRYLIAGEAREREGATEGVVERLVGDWLATDLNPATQAMRSLRHASNVVWALNSYTQSANVGVRTSIQLVDADAAGAPALAVNRDLRASPVDPVLCRAGVVSMMSALVAGAGRHADQGASAQTSITGIAHQLGVQHSAAAEAAAVLENRGGIKVALLARHLGCHPRTLERRLRAEGVTAELLRRATRLLRASARLRTTDSLTVIATDEGFSDLAHMSRSFKAASGMSASLLRQMAQGGVVAEATLPVSLQTRPSTG
ncbi:MAG: helix-turn-helix domain-containing protein [Rhizobacter sp.]